MDKSRVCKIIKKVMPALQSLLALEDWKFDITVEHIGPEDGEDRQSVLMGSCVAQANYHTAAITINPEQCGSPKDVVDILRHEMIHGFHSDHDIMRGQLRHVVDEKMFKMFEEVYYHAAEKTVCRIEAMLNRGLGVTAKKMMEAKRDDGNKQK